MRVPANVQHQRGFTLVELLVVLAIIIVLASIGVGIGGPMIERARKVHAMNEVNNLVLAIDQYQHDYSRLPVPPSAGPAGGGDLALESDSELMDILVGFDTVENPKGLPYFNGRRARGNNPATARGGLFYDPGGSRSVELFDPWRRRSSSPQNRHYYLILDTNLDGEIESPIRPSEIIYRQSAIVWSVGKDGELGSLGSSSDKAKMRDNVYSW